MLSFLKDHPFAVEAFFKRSIVLTFAIPRERISGLIPECLELDVLDDKWAFIAIAMVQTESLRPRGFPKFLGNDFFLIGYRVFVRFKNNAGKDLRGLYILRSETDKRKMKFFGNFFTHYNYTNTDINQTSKDEIIEISSKKSDFKIEIKNSNTNNVSLPEGSPFNDWKEARRFAGPLPFTFTYTPEQKKMLIIEGVRENWKPRPVHVINYKISFLDNLKLDTINLASAFIIENIPYYWKKGKTELWKKEEDSRVS
jgi:uncharacterized protein YqjF (DUF2071 family)